MKIWTESSILKISQSMAINLVFVGRHKNSKNAAFLPKESDWRRKD